VKVFAEQYETGGLDVDENTAPPELVDNSIGATSGSDSFSATITLRFYDI
jgi:hypothetical protein